MSISTLAMWLSFLGMVAVASIGYLSTRSSKAVESKDKREERLDRGLQEMLDDYRNEIERLVQKVERLEERTEKLEGINESQRAVIRDQADTLTQHERTIRVLTADNSRLTQRVAELEKGHNESC